MTTKAEMMRYAKLANQVDEILTRVDALERALNLMLTIQDNRRADDVDQESGGDREKQLDVFDQEG